MLWAEGILKKKLISVIVPIYNGEEKIETCVNTIINQTYKYIEIILINDGSTDKSLNVCNKMKKKDKRIKVISKKNGGVSSARNKGIEKAKGEFIQFVDVDDYLELDACETLINNIGDFDFLITGYKINSEKGEVYNKCINKEFDKISDIENDFYYLYKKPFLNSPWNKLYRKSLIKCYFDNNISLGEDLKFNLEYFNNSKNVKIIDDCIYNYTIDDKETLSKVYRYNQIEIDRNLYSITRRFCLDNFSENFSFEILDEELMDKYIESIKKVIKIEGEKRKLIKLISNIKEDKNISYLKEKSYVQSWKNKLIKKMIFSNNLMINIFYFISKFIVNIDKLKIIISKDNC